MPNQFLIFSVHAFVTIFFPVMRSEISATIDSPGNRAFAELTTGILKGKDETILQFGERIECLVYTFLSQATHAFVHQACHEYFLHGINNDRLMAVLTL